MTTPGPITPGAGITAADLNKAACDIVQGYASLSRRGTALAKYVEDIGIAGLQAAGFQATADAESYNTAVGLIKTVALLFSGGATQPDPYDFSRALAKYLGVPAS